MQMKYSIWRKKFNSQLPPPLPPPHRVHPYVRDESADGSPVVREIVDELGRDCAAPAERQTEARAHYGRDQHLHGERERPVTVRVPVPVLVPSQLHAVVVSGLFVHGQHRVVLITQVTGPGRGLMEREAADHAQKAGDQITGHVAREPRRRYGRAVFHADHNHVEPRQTSRAASSCVNFVSIFALFVATRIVSVTFFEHNV